MKSAFASMKSPRKHHFNPAFYLKPWAGNDEQLCEYKLVQPGKIVPKRKHPNATGYEIDLEDAWRQRAADHWREYKLRKCPRLFGNCRGGLR
jgi:hypothetical protein